MPGEAAALSRTWRVGKRRVTMTVPRPQNGQVVTGAMEWIPNMPRKLSRRECRQYRTGRDAAFAQLCRDLNIRGMLCEI